MKMARFNFEKLPDHIAVNIFRQLDVKCRLQMLTVNQRWNDLMPFDHLTVADLFERPSPDGWPSEQPVEFSIVTSALREILPKVGLKVKSVDFSYVELAAVHLDLIRQFCPNIRGVDLRQIFVSELNDVNIDAIEQMTSLTSLKIDDNGNLMDVVEDLPAEVTGRFLRNVTDVVRLLELEEFHFHFRPFPPAFTAPNLTTLEVHWGFTDEQLASICTVSQNLTSLTLVYCYGLTNFTPIGELSNLKVLMLRCTHVNDAQMELISRRCTQLSRIDLLTILMARTNWLQHLPNLKSLAIDLANTKMTDIPHNWAIEDLGIEANLPDAVMLQLSDKLPLLKRLHLHNGSLSDDLVVKLSGRWEMLEELRLTNVEISDESVVQLGLRKSLRLYDLRWENFHVDSFRLLLIKRQQQQISTPLKIQLGYERQLDIDFNLRRSSQLNEELKMVKVQILSVLNGSPFHGL